MITKYKLNVVSVNCYIYSKKEEFLMKNGFKKFCPSVVILARESASLLSRVPASA